MWQLHIVRTVPVVIDKATGCWNTRLCMLQFQKKLKQLVQRAASHPKMEKLLEVVLGHFTSIAAAEAGEAPAGVADATGAAVCGVMAEGAEEECAGPAQNQPGRVIIFTNRRDSVQSIVDMLRPHEPRVTAR